ncbi:MAG TPA: PPC domain-containing protein [Ideonella sp.]|nr:PPC domain-containing protein [Ideonella sp.]
MFDFSLRQVAAAALICATGTLAAAQQADPAPSGRAAFPSIALQESGASGERAIALLGDRLPAVAAAYRKSPQALREMLLRDNSLKLDRTGRLYVVDTLDRPLPPAPATPAEQQAAAESLAPLDQTFKLHTRPTAKRTIYLDFNGAVLQGTAWNGGTPTINALPFDSDGNSAAFSDAELERIQYIWQRVAEDYAPFDVDVTTEQPPAARLSRASATDDIFGTTVLVTNHNGVYACSCGGVAYLGIFDDTSDFYKPALVFWDMLGAGDEKYVAEAISHEAGHNLALQHDGYAGGGYYPGHGSGATGWAPIMGVGYYQPVVQWSQGEYATANNTEDDFAVMQATGLPLRKDDHGNKTGTATALTATPSGALTLLSGAGVIERRKDKDFFSFSAGAGTATISVSPDARAANLDLRLQVLDASGAQLRKAQPPATLAASLTVTLPSAGTYYLVVEGVGTGDPATTGYSDYGSVGQYTVSGSVPTP